MNEKGRNILPMIGIIVLITLLLGGFAMASQMNSNLFSNRKTESKNITGRHNINQHEALSTQSIDKIVIRSISSNINVYTHKEDQVKANFYGNVTITGKGEVPYLEVENNGKTASVRIVHPNVVGFSISGETTLDVHVPESWAKDLDIGTISGKITANALTGENVSLNTTSGSMDVRHIQASDTIKTSTISGKCTIGSVQAKEGKFNSTSGNIIIDTLSVDALEARSVSGRIEVKTEGKKAEIATTSGEIHAIFLNEMEEFKARSISGRVRLGLPKDSAFKVDIKTVSGSIRCRDFSVNATTSKERELKGKVGNGNGSVEISTTSGSVEIYQN